MERRVEVKQMSLTAKQAANNARMRTDTDPRAGISAMVKVKQRIHGYHAAAIFACW